MIVGSPFLPQFPLWHERDEPCLILHGKHQWQHWVQRVLWGVFACTAFPAPPSAAIAFPASPQCCCSEDVPAALSHPKECPTVFQCSEAWARWVTAARGTMLCAPGNLWVI